jgi:hypothetical protein
MTQPGVFVRHSFTAVRTEPNGTEITFDVETDRGQHRCRQLKITAPDITRETLRQIPFATYMKRAVGMVAYKPQRIEELPEPMANALTEQGLADRKTFVTIDDGERGELYRSTRRRRPQSALTDEHLKKVADEYRSALDDGFSPTETVAYKMNAARSTAARWVMRARKRGFLGPAIPGRPGELETPENTKENDR